MRLSRVTSNDHSMTTSGVPSSDCCVAARLVCDHSVHPAARRSVRRGREPLARTCAARWSSARSATTRIGEGRCRHDPRKGQPPPTWCAARLNGFATRASRRRYFCGGGWYFDQPVAETLATFGYVDCSATTFRQDYLADDAPRLQLDGPRTLRLPSGALLRELPATHSLGMLVRGLATLRGPVHLHFHDWELLDRRRALALEVVLRALRLRRRAIDADELVQRTNGAALLAWPPSTINPS